MAITSRVQVHKATRCAACGYQFHAKFFIPILDVRQRVYWDRRFEDDGTEIREKGECVCDPGAIVCWHHDRAKLDAVA